MIDVEQRFWSKVDKSGECWIFTGSTREGYGQFWKDGRLKPAHRASYELAGKVIPEGLVIDHLCGNRSCVRPDHLEPVTNLENIRRGKAARPRGPNKSAGEVSRSYTKLQTTPNKRGGYVKTHCLRGHRFTEENTYVNPSGKFRHCRICRRETLKRAYQKYKVRI